MGYDALAIESPAKKGAREGPGAMGIQIDSRLIRTRQTQEAMGSQDHKQPARLLRAQPVDTRLT